jgi:hypothetical protein
MSTSAPTDNKIFKYAFTGVILLIAAIGFTFANFSNVVMFELSSSVIVGTLGFSSFSLLYKAIKKDNDRLKQHA